MVAISQAPSPESNPNSPLPVISLVSPYLTIPHLIGQSFVWYIANKTIVLFLLQFAKKREINPVSSFCHYSLCCLIPSNKKSQHRLLITLKRSVFIHFLLPRQSGTLFEKTKKKRILFFLSIDKGKQNMEVFCFLIHVLALQLTGLSK